MNCFLCGRRKGCTQKIKDSIKYEQCPARYFRLIPDKIIYGMPERYKYG